MVKDKTRVLDEEKQLRKRVDEEFEKMQRKWNAISQSDSGVQDQLAEECENLRVSGIVMAHCVSNGSNKSFLGYA